MFCTNQFSTSLRRASGSSNARLKEVREVSHGKLRVGRTCPPNVRYVVPYFESGEARRAKSKFLNPAWYSCQRDSSSVSNCGRYPEKSEFPSVKADRNKLLKVVSFSRSTCAKCD